MRRIERLYTAVALVTAVAMGCGDGGTEGTGGGGGQAATTSSMSASSSSTGGSGGGGGSGGSAPICPKEDTVLAVKELHFGEGNSGEWKKLGFNVDGLVSTALSKDVCQPNDGGQPINAYPDGDEGIDNSFGNNLLPTILSVYPTWVVGINNNILEGKFTALFKIECLPPKGDAPVLTTKLFGGTKLPAAPKFDGTDVWPVEQELLSDPKDPDSSTIAFQNSSVEGASFDSGNKVTIILTVPLETETKKTSIKLTMHSARMTFTLAADRKSATGGIIGGVVDTEELVAEVKKVAYLLDFCDDSLFDALISQVRQSSDIMNDGGQDPTQVCNGISIGLGFEMNAAKLGAVGPPAEVGLACP